MYKYKITIFTPTYNRGYIINNLYQSIRNQIFRDFEWIIYDDGSTDNTEQLVKQWLDDKNDFPIRYYKGQNGGKCRAINRGLELAQGEMFFVMDSDDYLTEDACDKINTWMESIRGIKELCGVAGNRGQTPTETRNTLWLSNPETPWYNKEYREASYFETYNDKKDFPIDGERAEVFWTDIFRKYPYPEFEGENFLTPCVSFNRMANDGYKIRYYEDIIWIWEYLEDGLTIKGGNNRFTKNPKGHFLSHKEKCDFLHYPLKKRLKMYYTFYCDFSEILTKKQIAEYMDAPYIWICMCAVIHKFINLVRGKKK